MPFNYCKRKYSNHVRYYRIMRGGKLRRISKTKYFSKIMKGGLTQEEIDAIARTSETNNDLKRRKKKLETEITDITIQIRTRIREIKRKEGYNRIQKLSTEELKTRFKLGFFDLYIKKDGSLKLLNQKRKLNRTSIDRIEKRILILQRKILPLLRKRRDEQRESSHEGGMLSFFKKRKTLSTPTQLSRTDK